jgi:hypothetical protein
MAYLTLEDLQGVVRSSFFLISIKTPPTWLCRNASCASQAQWTGR